ncbi:putative aldouronate transport system permease protein [Paenibacillus rhizosphaerae]|uniref:Putative aldouronate transport system permease protein n=1 Tax=Paenibacillus rhizosphaerae TaxID=297318 RepID=A0A839TF69_9BACL|nr:carbohydrate ABC transporter permease [Paenibacillus rhizosphaerae]MBB3125476.1 putative aldouronate transport system permease protein [Paenibacillus rhizosphaerae]
MKKRSFSDWSLDIFVYLILSVAGLITLLPLANVFSKSVSAEWAVISGKVNIWPVGFQLDTLRNVVTSSVFVQAFAVSVFVTVVGTLLSIFVTAITAYPLSKRLPGISFVMVLFIFTMLFNGGLIPTYLLIRNLHLLDTLWSLILPAVVNVFNLLVMKSYYETLPEALEESARIDGAKTYAILFKIILPLSMPVIATISLFYAVFFWNDYFHPMLYINDEALKTLQLYLRDVVMQADSATAASKSIDELMNMSPEGVRAATVVASTVPIICVYPFLQKYFIKGVLVGSVKG